MRFARSEASGILVCTENLSSGHGAQSARDNGTHCRQAAGIPSRAARALQAAGIALTPTLSLIAKLPIPPEIAARVVDTVVNQLKVFSDSGATVLFGTDVGYTQLYDTTLEYELMRRALSERQLLASLTTNPASYFKTARRTG